MKTIILFVLTTVMFACKKNNSGYNTNNPPPDNGNNGNCGTYAGYTLYKDTSGCYYNNANYAKVYIDKSYCTCQ